MHNKFSKRKFLKQNLFEKKKIIIPMKHKEVIPKENHLKFVSSFCQYSELKFNSLITIISEVFLRLLKLEEKLNIHLKFYASLNIFL